VKALFFLGNIDPSLGTLAGDPIEASAIASAFESRHRKLPLYIGSVKANIGHLEAAAGVAGVIRGVLMLENGIIPPAANFEKINPNIPLEEWNIRVATKPTPWPAETRRMSVNSFGFGGANAHIVLDDALSFLLKESLHGIHRTLPSRHLAIANDVHDCDLPNGHDILHGREVSKSHEISNNHDVVSSHNTSKQIASSNGKIGT
jgi:hypothetical protein